MEHITKGEIVKITDPALEGFGDFFRVASMNDAKADLLSVRPGKKIKRKVPISALKGCEAEYYDIQLQKLDDMLFNGDYCFMQ